MTRSAPSILSIVWLLAAAALGTFAHAAELPAQPPGGESQGALQFRRVYAPADRVEDWPWGKGRYLPMDAARFERLLAAARNTAADARPPAAAGWANGRYQARLVGYGPGSSDLLALTDGKATLQVIHTADNPVLLPLDPCGLAVTGARWGSTEKTEKTETADAEPGEVRRPEVEDRSDGEPNEAVLGLGADGTLQALVSRSGVLNLDWSLSGVRDPSGAIEFQIELPPSPANRFILDLPEELRPSTDAGMVLPAGRIDERTRRWEIELGGRHRFRLKVTADVQPARDLPDRPSTLVRGAMEYHFSLRGLELAAQWDLQTVLLGRSDETLEEISLTLDPGLLPVSVQYGNVPLSWTVVSPPESPATQLTLAPPATARNNGGGTLKLRALAPLVIDRPWRLPRVRLAEALWQEGRTTLLVPVPLQIESVVPSGCRQTGTGPLTAPLVGESVEFQCFARDAALEVLLRRHRTPARIAVGTAVELGEAKMTAEVRADLRLAEGSQFTLRADLNGQWEIDAVESFPPDALDDWTDDRPGRPKRTLSVRLARALSPQRPIRLLITAHCLLSPLGRELRLDDLVPLRFRVASAGGTSNGDVSHGRHLVAVRAVAPYHLEISGTEHLRRIDKLDPAELGLFDETPRTLLFADDGSAAGSEGRSAAGLRVALQRRQESYSAEIRVEASVTGTRLREYYTLRCIPKSSRVDRVTVHFSHPRDAGPVWTLGTEARQQLTASRLSIEEQTAAGLDPEQETWVLRLRRPRSEPFEVHGVRETALTSPLPISLVSLPGAAGQQATLAVRCLGPRVPRISGGRLERIPGETVPFDRYPTTCATYRYDPAGDVMAAADATVTVSPLPVKSEHNADRRPVWIWHGHLQSRYEADGTGRHLAVYRLENSGGGRISLRLPPQTSAEDVDEIRLDGNRAAWRERAGNLEIELPPGERFPTLAVHFSTAAVRLGTVGTLRPPLPKADLPILSQHWTVRLPPGYRAFDCDPQWQHVPDRPVNWRRRLFGPVGRAERTVPFNPAVGNHWIGVTVGHTERRLAERRAGQLLERIGTLVADADAPTGATRSWAEVLADRSLDGLEVTLLIDRHALARLDVAPQTAIRPVSARQPLDRAAAVLQDAGLALLVHADVALLTGGFEAELYHAHLEPLRRRPVWRLLPGPLAEQLLQAAEGKSELYVSGDAWRRSPAEPKTLWTRGSSAVRQIDDSHAWKVYRLEIPNTGEVSLKVVHGGTMRLLGTAVFLLVVALGWWKAKHRPMLLTAAAGLSGVAALTLSGAYVPIASGAVLGSLFCLVRVWIRSRNAARPESSASKHAKKIPSTVSLSARILPLLVVAAMLSLFCAVARGNQAEASPEEPRPPDRRPVLRVFIPIDENEQPTGGKVHVPEPLFQELLRRQTAATEKPRGWLLTGATYHGVLSKDTTTQRLTLDELRAGFELQVLGATARVRIPLRREEANLLPGGVLLDARAVQPEWNADGDALTVEVSQPGTHRLELALHPPMRIGDPAGFDLAIPPLATSRLLMDVPPGTGQVQVPSARGAVRVEEDPPRVAAELGPCQRLSVRWPQDPDAAAVGPVVEVEELLWLNVRPGSVVLDARLKLHVVEGHAQRIELAADPRLRLDRLQIDDQTVEKPQTIPGRPQIIRVAWPDPTTDTAGGTASLVAADTVLVEVSLLLKGASGVGNLRLPELHVLDANSTRRWLAVSIDPDLIHTPPESLDPVALPDFLAKWNPAPSQPVLVCRVDSHGGDWSLSTSPRRPQTAVNQTMAVSFGRESADVRFDAELNTTVGYNFQYRLTAVPGLQIDHVSLLEEGAQRVARWSQSKKGTVTVFLTEPAAGQQQLTLRGRLPIRNGGRKPVSVPAIRIEAAETETSTLQIFRRPPVLVKVARSTGLSEVQDPPAAQDDPQLGRPVGTFHADTQKPSRITLNIEPNRPDVRATQLTRLRREGTAWWADVRCLVEVSGNGGVIDEIRLEAPGPFDGPYTLQADPPAELHVDDLPGEPRQLVVRPQSAVDARFDFTVSGPLTLAPGERAAVPPVELKHIEPVERLVVLPEQPQGRWETRGLKRLEPSGDAPAIAQDESGATYRIVGQPWQAILRPPDRTRSETRVRLADIRVAWQADGTCRGVATFDLQPGRSTQVPLSLPTGYRPVQVAVAGVPTVPTPVRAGAWRVPLGPRHLPQRLEVVFTGTLPDPTSAGRRFDAPSLGTLPVERTLWTVAGPTLFEPGTPNATTAPAPAWRHELIRLRTAAASIASAASSSSQHAEETFRWYWPRARRMAGARAALRRQLTRAGKTEKTRAAWRELGQIDRQQATIAKSLEMSNVLSQLSAGATVAVDPVELWHRSLDPRQAAARFTVSEGSTSLTLPYRRVQSGRWLRLLGSVAALAALMGLSVFAVRRGWAAELLVRWPAAAGVAVGLVWWLWFVPSFLGWIIVAASVTASFLPGWRYTRPAPGSSVIAIRSLRR